LNYYIVLYVPEIRNDCNGKKKFSYSLVSATDVKRKEKKKNNSRVKLIRSINFAF
jgi:hypothetical protein